MVQDIVTTHTTIAILILSGLAVLNLLLVLILLISGGNLRRKFKKWKSIHETADLDIVYRQTLTEVASVKQELTGIVVELDNLRETMKSRISTAKIIRYNAFSDTGSDLSFSIALLDDNNNGVVLSSIYGREESRTYAKPIVRGESTYALTEEERAVLQDVSESHVVHSRVRV